MLKPGMDDLVFIGFAQSLPTLFPFVECKPISRPLRNRERNVNSTVNIR